MIDWTALSERFNGREDFIAKLIDMVLRSHAETPARLRAAAHCKELALIAQMAHGLKSTTGNLEASMLHELAKATEQAAKDDDHAACTLAERLADGVDALLTELKRRVEAKSTA